MKKHRGMRPLDVVILLKIAALRQTEWTGKLISESLGISASEVSESLNRSSIAGLLSADRKKLMTQSLLDFLVNGLRYVFPQMPGTITRGMPTAHSAAPLKKMIQSEEYYVWPDAKGTHRGLSIEPLHPGVLEACRKDKNLYALLALADVLRVGKSREKSLAIGELKKVLD